MKRFKHMGIMLALFALAMVPPQTSMAQNAKGSGARKKPRLAILNLVPRVVPIEKKTGLPKGLPGKFRKMSEFDMADSVLTQKLIEEWARSATASQQKRGRKLGRLYDVQMMVAGKVHAIKQRKWVVSFVQLNAPPDAPGKEKSVASKSEFYSILDERDPVVGPVLADLAGVFGFRKSLASKGRQKRLCEDAITEDEVKALVVDKTLVVLEQFYIRFRADGVWEASSDPDDLNERGKWWMEGKRLCETVPRVDKAPCRCLKKDKSGEYSFVWEGGAVQYFRFQ